MIETALSAKQERALVALMGAKSLDQPDADLAEWTRGQVESQPEFQPLSTWRKVFAEKLGAARASK
jgi:hypothetical protein